MYGAGWVDLVSSVFVGVFVGGCLILPRVDFDWFREASEFEEGIPHVHTVRRIELEVCQAGGGLDPDFIVLVVFSKGYPQELALR